MRKWGNAAKSRVVKCHTEARQPFATESVKASCSIRGASERHDTDEW